MPFPALCPKFTFQASDWANEQNRGAVLHVPPYWDYPGVLPTGHFLTSWRHVKCRPTREMQPFGRGKRFFLTVQVENFCAID